MNKARFFELVNPVAELLEAKHHDYDAGGVKLEDYFPFNDQSYVQMIHVKTLRLVSLLSSGNYPKHEAIRDTLEDMINYAVFYLDYLDNEERT